MPLDTNHALAPLVRKLDQWQPLNNEEHSAVLALPHVTRDLKAHQYVVWDGDRPQHTCMIFWASLTGTSLPATAAASPLNPHARRSDRPAE